MIPYGKQNINQADIDAVVAVLRSDFITQGPAIENFENEIVRLTGAKYAVAVSNATAALHIACLAAGLKHGDIMYTSPVTFVASANCGLYCGAAVEFVDINPLTYNLDPENLEQKLIQAAAKGKLPKVVIPVHLAGQSCEMDKIHALSLKYGFSIIEDASHAIGGKYKSSPVGSCQFSDMTVFSFHPVKIVTTGEGGVICTNSKELFEKLILLRSHGITRRPDLLKRNDGPWYYEQHTLGFNYRMTDIQAALGASQLQRLDLFIGKRNELASAYHQILKDLPLVTPFVSSDALSAYHLYVIRLKSGQVKKSHLEVFNALRAAGIGVNLHYMPVYRQPYYEQYGYQKSEYPQSEKYYAEAISLPMYYDLSVEQQSFIGKTLKEIL